MLSRFLKLYLAKQTTSRISTVVLLDLLGVFPCTFLERFPCQKPLKHCKCALWLVPSVHNSTHTPARPQAHAPASAHARARTSVICQNCAGQCMYSRVACSPPSKDTGRALGDRTDPPAPPIIESRRLNDPQTQKKEEEIKRESKRHTTNPIYKMYYVVPMCAPYAP